jgi:membrane protease YdiL (CAAX protease family)
LQNTPHNLQQERIPRGLEIALCVTALAWAGAASSIAAPAARGIAVRFQIGAFEPLMQALFLLFLAIVGLRCLDWISTRGRHLAEVAPLPKRTGWSTEWGVGAAIGWGLCIAAVLPLLLSGNLHGRLMWQPSSALAILLAIATLLAVSLAEEVLFRGYAFRRLAGAIGPSWAAILLSLVFSVSLILSHRPPNPTLALIDGALFGLLLTMAWLRTHALWLGWGLHFAYRAVMAILLGLPIAGHGEFGSIADVFSGGPRWLSGGAFGLDAAFFTAIVLWAGMAVLFRATRDYAWNYTHAPVVAAGYEVTVAPPAAHVAMEKQAAAPPPLVQIMPVPPPPPLPGRQE